ncbi:ABC transporter F family member 5 [Durusdinium trenchii]|uniref:ABC transporter F family member 5 n=1 Tax=Durusdinium trenchii TaxID=1381693 RepID=A0ABP0J4K6_9DINO
MDPHERHVEILKVWLAENGVSWDEKAIELTTASGDVPLVGGMGVRSSRPLRAGEVLATIPKSAVLSIRNTQLAPQLSDLDLDVALRCAICAERALGEKSQWHGYFRSLLRSNEPLPYLWSCPERQLLLGTDAYATVEETLELLREEFREHQQLLHSPPLHEVTITEEDYLHAATLASSRAARSLRMETGAVSEHGAEKTKAVSDRPF